MRNYQKELAQPGIEGKNYIMIAPTGSGKTLAIALVISDHLNKHQQQLPCHVAFVTETKPLADQQSTALNEYIPEARVDVCTGDNRAKVADSIKQNNNISVCTAGKLLEEIKGEIVTFDQLSLIVFDECHHAKKGHPFSKLMELYLEYRENPEREGGLPQVIGATASPGAGDNSSLDRSKTIDHLVDLAAHMDATSGFKTVTDRENLEELHKCSKSSEFNVKHLNPRDISNDPFFLEVAEDMDQLEKLVPKNLMKTNFPKWSHEYETKVQQVKSLFALTTDPKARDDTSTLNLLRCYSSALNFYMDMQQKDALTVMREHKDLPDDDSKCTPRELDLKRKLKLLRQRAERIPPKNNPLLESMKQILCDTFRDNPSSRGIVFVRTKRNAHAMSEWVTENPALKAMINPDVITGQTRETGEGMTQVTQSEVMSSFHKGETNLLIATTVAEEGLDIPECNLMIRYEHVTNEIAKVQTHGRARAENSHGYLLASSSRKKYQEFKNQGLIFLVDEILENQWFPADQHLKEKLIEKQQMILDRKKLKMRLKKEQQQKNKSKEVVLYCGKCRVHACYGSDVYTITDDSNSAFHYLVPGDSFTAKYTTKLHHKPADLVPGKIKKTHKIYCSKCDHDWGVRCLWPTKGHEFPVIKCKSFIFEVNKFKRTLKKWKDAPFEIKPLTSWLYDDNDSSSAED